MIVVASDSGRMTRKRSFRAHFLDRRTGTRTLQNCAGPKTRRIDLTGHAVIPGINDAAGELLDNPKPSVDNMNAT